MTTGQDEFGEIITQVLTENTAQSVLNHLNVLESNRAHLRTRWVWELLQNARDASANSDSKLVASVEQSEHEVVFRHNGGSFKREEIIHLIFHGSTKAESEDTIGQYGSGFLTTHLLSPEIEVSGQLEDGRNFAFRLKRELGSVSGLSDSMQNAAGAFVKSLTNVTSTHSFTTEFRYPLRGDALEVVTEGIATLKQCAPYVVVFNKEFSGISIESSVGTVEFKVIGRAQLKQGELELATVSEIEYGNQRNLQYLVSKGNRSTVAIPVEFNDDSQACLPLGHTPRFFLGFPLVGTESFSFPAIINSFQFTPTPNRDGVFLWQAPDAANQENQAVLEEACELLAGMLHFAASSGWNNAYFLAEVPYIQAQSWLNEEELRACLKERLIERFRQTPAVLNESGEAMRPKDSELPLANTTEGVVHLWELLVGWQEGQDIWPRRNEVVGWSSAIRSWARLTNREILSFDEVIDGRKLASIVDQFSLAPKTSPKTHRVSLLQDNLKEDIPAIYWLDQLIGFLRRDGLGEVVDEFCIVPSQARFLRTMRRLHRDLGISPVLKDIAVLLDWRIRPELRDSRMSSLDEESGAEDWGNEYVVGELIKKIRERAEKNPDDNFRNASISLFTWMVQQENWDALRGFPVFSRRVAPDRPIEVVYLPRNSEDVIDPVAPLGAWPEDLRPFADLFPPNRILADDFFDALPNIESWQLLVDQTLVKTELVVSNMEHFSKFYPDSPLPEEVGHQTVELVPVTDLWSRPVVMDRVRDSQERAVLFWRFLTDWLVKRELQSLEITEAACECGEKHRYFPASWIEPLRENNWIRLPNDRRDKANAQSLAHLLRSVEDWDPNSLSENSTASKLLDAIGVSRLGLMQELVAKDDKSRAALDNSFISILAAVGNNLGNLEHARQYVEDLNEDQDLPAVLDERRERRRQIHNNQRLGSLVETLVKKSLEAEGFDVRRTGIGSDFAIEFNDVTRLELAKYGRTWLVEVKATRDNRVRMTDTQAATAVSEGENFLLCVVPVEGEPADLELSAVRDNMRFVAQIGPRVVQMCIDLDDLKQRRDEITAIESEGIQLELDSGTARVRVASSVWEQEGFPLVELPDRLK